MKTPPIGANTTTRAASGRFEPGTLCTVGLLMEYPE